MDITTATPVEIDTQLWDLYQQRQRAGRELSLATITLRHRVGDKLHYTYNGQSWGLTEAEVYAKAEEIAAGPVTLHQQKVIEALHQIEGCHNVLRVNAEEAEVFNAEFERRGGWTRGFLVTDGHVHSSMNCSTCYITTSYYWLVEFSGRTEAEVVEAAGERACTVCYPSAPVDVLKRESTLFTPAERDRAAERAQREAEKDARRAARIAKGLTADGSPFTVVVERQVESRSRPGVFFDKVEEFKTERSAVIWAVDQLAMAKSSYYSKIVTKEHLDAVEAILRASAAKHDKRFEDLLEEVDKKAVAKARKEYGA